MGSPIPKWQQDQVEDSQFTSRCANYVIEQLDSLRGATYLQEQHQTATCQPGTILVGAELQTPLQEAQCETIPTRTTQKAVENTLGHTDPVTTSSMSSPSFDLEVEDSHFTSRYANIVIEVLESPLQKSYQAEVNTSNVLNYSSKDEAVIYEQENSPLVMDGLQLQDNQPDTQKTEVMIEATKSTPKSSAESPSIPQNDTRVRRKYAQRKGVESNPTEERSDETGLEKNAAPDSVDSSVGKRKYVKRKAVSKPEEEIDTGLDKNAAPDSVYAQRKGVESNPAEERSDETGLDKNAAPDSVDSSVGKRKYVKRKRASKPEEESMDIGAPEKTQGKNRPALSRSKIHHLESDEEKLGADKEPEDDSTKEVNSVKPSGSSSVELIENDNLHGRDAQDTFSSRNSAFPRVAQTTEKIDSCLPNTSDEPKADIIPDRVTSSNSFAKLLQMVDTVLHGVYEK